MRAVLLLVAITAAAADEAIADATPPPPPEASEGGGAAEAASCMSFCNEEPCTAFNGNLTSECGACDSAVAKCYPGAEGFDTWFARRSKNSTLIAEDEARNAANLRSEL